MTLGVGSTHELTQDLALEGQFQAHGARELQVRRFDYDRECKRTLVATHRTQQGVTNLCEDGRAEPEFENQRLAGRGAILTCSTNRTRHTGRGLLIEHYY